MAEATIDTVVIFTSRMEELAAFYCQGLGLSDAQPTGVDHVGLRVGEVYLGFDRVKEAGERGTEGPARGVSLWFRVENLEACVKRFVELGARVRYEKKEMPWGDVLASLYDLDGNIFGLAKRKIERG